KVDITKAKKAVELTKDNRKILVTIYEGGQVSSCIEDEAKKYCETCQCDDELCQEWIDHLKSQGYDATEFELGELELEESLPKFLEQREVILKPEVVAEPEESERAFAETDENLPGGSETSSEGE
ncbi:MAG: hypothetical protein JRC90_11075, partial [Deltaproteobacteria bacterium]|nr:hypothetical protein [Deltaproteobacteria bacterium]